MLRWLPLLLLPIVGFAITQNCQNSTHEISETKNEMVAPPSLPNGVTTPTMQVVVKRGSARQAARVEQSMPKQIKRQVPITSKAEALIQQQTEVQDVLDMRRTAKDALTEEIKSSTEPSQTIENDLVRDDKKWIDSLSGLSLQNNKAKSAKRECDMQRCPSKGPYVNVFGVVIESENPEMDGSLEQGSFVDNTPAFYIK